MPDFTAPGVNSFESDPDLSDVVDLSKDTGSDYDDLLAELTANVTNDVDLLIPRRPGWAFRCRTDFTGADLDLLRKKAKNKRFVDGIDSVKFNSLTLGLTNVAIIRDGDADALADALGVTAPVTVATPELRNILKTSNVDETVRALFGSEGDLSAATSTLMTEAGWGDEGQAQDPTQ